MKKLKSKWIKKDKTSRLYEIPVPILGLTGGIATGKSTVAQFFVEQGILVIDADKLVKDIYTKMPSVEFIRLNFPEAIIDGKIQFKKLRELAFLTVENQLKLENFIYAQMPEAFKEAYQGHDDYGFVVYDVPLLFEKKLDDKIDVSICTYCPRHMQLERLIRRDQISLNLAEKILSKQMDIEAKKMQSDLVIENIADIKALRQNFDKLMTTLLE